MTFAEKVVAVAWSQVGYREMQETFGYKEEDGTYTDLAHPNIDTGMGLERLACIMQGVDSIYNIDTMHEILQEVCRLSGVTYQDGAAPTDVSLRIITDHVRTVSFMIGDMKIALSGLAIASIVGIILNAILPGKRDEYMPNQENSGSLGKF